ncbi:MAG: hypothetical protein R2844_17420 [Caldilineales bacterium]
MDAQTLLLERRLAGFLLIGCFLVFVVGGLLYTGRAILKWPAAQTDTYLLWERGWVIAAALVNVLGFVVLADLLQNSGDLIIARLALTVYVIGTAVLLAAEGTFLHDRQWVTAQVVIYVALAFLVQAAFGVALLRTGIVPAWAAWLTIVWNLGWLALFAVLRPDDIYYPVLHHVAPVLIGVALLMRV